MNNAHKQFDYTNKKWVAVTGRDSPFSYEHITVSSTDHDSANEQNENIQTITVHGEHEHILVSSPNHDHLSINEDIFDDSSIPTKEDLTEELGVPQSSTLR